MIIQEIKDLSDDIDKEYVHTVVKNMVESGEEEGYFQAFTRYVVENDIDMDNAKKYLSPTLYEIIKYEVINRGLLVDEDKYSGDIDDLFS